MRARRYRSRCERVAACALLLALAAPTAVLRAQPGTYASVRADCDDFSLPNDTPNHDAWLAVWPRSFWPALRPLVAEGRFVEAGDSVRAYAQRVARVSGDSQPPQVLQAIDSLRTSLVAAEKTWRSGGPGAVVPANLFQPRAPQNPGDTRLTWMLATPFTVTVDASTSPTVRRAVCWPLRVAGLLADAAGKGARDFTIRELKTIRQHWENFRGSYSLLPHELVLNELATRAFAGGNHVYSLEPPRTQIIALHPTVGYQVRPISTSNAVGSPALVVDWGGLLYYTESRATYAGASFISSFPSRPGEGSRYGVMGTWSKLGRIGLLLPTKHESARNVGAVLNVDVYKLLPMARKAIDERVADISGRETACAGAPQTNAASGCWKSKAP